MTKKKTTTAIILYDKLKNSSQLSNHSKDIINTSKCTVKVQCKEADSLTKTPQENNQVVDVTEDRNSSICRLSRESVSDALKKCFAPFQIFDSFEKSKSKVDTFSIDWGFIATSSDYRIHCN